MVESHTREKIQGLFSLRIPVLLGSIALGVTGFYASAWLDGGRHGLVDIVTCALLALLCGAILFSSRVRQLAVAPTRRDWYHPSGFWLLMVVLTTLAGLFSYERLAV